MNHHYTLNARWKGGLGGTGTIAIGNLESEVSAPKDFGGAGVGTNPEEMITGAASTCYLITLGAILARRQVKVESLHLETNMTLSTDSGMRITHIVHKPTLTLAAGSTDEDRSNAFEACEKAEKMCLISTALRGNVELSVSQTIL